MLSNLTLSFSGLGISILRQGSQHLPCVTLAACLDIADTQGYKHPLPSTASLPQKSRNFQSHAVLLATILPFLHEARAIVPLQTSAHATFLLTHPQPLCAFGKASDATGKPSLLQQQKPSPLSLAHT